MVYNLQIAFSSFLFLCASFVYVNGAPGTTLHLRNIFLGRCFEFQETRKHISPEILKKNCTQLYEAFVEAVDSKTTCKGNYSTIFDDYFKLIDPGLTSKKALFWSGTMDFAHDLSFANPDYATLEDTFPGYISNDIKFCYGDHPLSFNFTACKCSWPESASNVFWSGASKQFAKNANGNVQVFLNGTRKDHKPAYRGDSIFAMVELPNINATLVNSIKILIGWDLGVKPKQTCKSKSILKMKADIKKKKIPVSCEDNPRVVFHIMCSNNPASSLCKAMKKSSGDESKVSSAWKLVGIIFAAVSGVLVIALIIAMVKICRKPSNFKEF